MFSVTLRRKSIAGLVARTGGAVAQRESVAAAGCDVPGILIPEFIDTVIHSGGFHASTLDASRARRSVSRLDRLLCEAGRGRPLVGRRDVRDAEWTGRGLLRD